MEREGPTLEPGDSRLTGGAWALLVVAASTAAAFQPAYMMARIYIHAYTLTFFLASIERG